MPQVGDTITFVPYAFDRNARMIPRGAVAPYALRGVVIDVNAEHRHYTVEAQLYGFTIRESYKF